jgi:small subunit ribosomal protein S6
MPHYENVFVTRQEVSAAQVDALADSFAEIITSGGGTIHRREYWGLKSLSYKIKKNRKAHFVLLNIEAPSDTVREMERNMRLNEDVLRHLTIREEAAPEGPSVMMQGRGERERAHRDSDDRPPAKPAPAETKGEDTPKAEAKGEAKGEDTPKAEAKGEAKAETKAEAKTDADTLVVPDDDETSEGDKK